MPQGIRDKVAILGMGCSKFGERWDMDADDLMVEAYAEALSDAGIETKEIDAAWLATAIEEQHVGKSAVPLAVALRLPYIPVTRVENYCASGTEAFRGAAYAVASGAADIALALGVEKLKDTGYGGLPQRSRGTLQFPMSRICGNPNCNAIDAQEEHPFAEKIGRINSYTADRLTYSPDPPACYGMIQFEEGGRWLMDFTDIDEAELAVGRPMRMMFRIKDIDTQRGFRRYFWKAAPLAQGPLAQGPLAQGRS